MEMYHIDHDYISLTSSDKTKLEHIVKDVNFLPERMNTTFCSHACKWVKSLAEYLEQMKFTRPKVEWLKQAWQELEQKRDSLVGKADEINVML